MTAKKDAASEATTKDETATDRPEFAIQRLYLKDLSFESPAAPKIFREQWKPEMNVELQTKAEALEDDIHDVELMVTVTVKSGETTAFLVEVKYAGIFTVKHFPEEQKGPILGSVCPSILFPYVREIVSDVVTRASFPQLVLAPINFDALYQQHLQKRAEAAEGKQ